MLQAKYVVSDAEVMRADAVESEPAALQPAGTSVEISGDGVLPRPRPGKLKSVAIVAMGISMCDYMAEATNAGGAHALADEIWAIGNQGGVLQADRVFMMNDVEAALKKSLAEHRVDALEAVRWLKKHPGPVYCATSHPDYPALVEYPINDVLSTLRHPYLNGSVAYAIALAIHEGVQTIRIYGCDFTYPDNHVAEKGRACAEFWLHRHLMLGGSVYLPANTNFMDWCVPMNERFYGYPQGSITVDIVDGVPRVTKVVPESLPGVAAAMKG